VCPSIDVSPPFHPCLPPPIPEVWGCGCGCECEGVGEGVGGGVGSVGV